MIEVGPMKGSSGSLNLTSILQSSTLDSSSWSSAWSSISSLLTKSLILTSEEHKIYGKSYMIMSWYAPS
jgi:hypothetical protein